jgi:SH3 domain-containing YSC84-like protein 1
MNNANRKQHHKQNVSASKEKVRKVQTALKDRGLNPGPIDGVMGSKTMAAIREFQSQQGMAATGRLDQSTMAALQIDVAPGTGTTQTSSLSDQQMKRQNEQIELGIPQEQQTLQTQPNQPAPNQQTQQTQQTPADIGVGPTAFAVEDIRQVQIMLKNRGYDPGDTNGMLSSETQEAIRQFQTANNLPVTGKIDQRTQMALGVPVKGTEQNQVSSAQNQNQTQMDQARMKPGTSTESDLSIDQSTSQSVQGETGTDQGRMKPGTSAETQTEPQHRTDHDKSSTTQDSSTKMDKDAMDRVEKAASVLQSLTEAEDKRIPNEMLERAEAVMVIPDMVKGALGIGGRYGKGVVSRRLPGGRWSAPAFVQIGGGSWGAQIGVTSTDLVLIFTDAKALDQLESGKDLKLGVDAGVVAGPIGRSAEAGVNAKLETAVYAYSRSKGLFAGAALDGAVLDLDDSMNKKVYGQNVSVADVLNGKMTGNMTGRRFMDSLERVIPKKRISQR